MNGHINETAPPLVPIGEVKLVQVQIVVWFVRTCEVWILFVLQFCLLAGSTSLLWKLRLQTHGISLLIVFLFFLNLETF